MVTLIEKLYSIRLGVQGENIAQPVEIDMTSWAEAFPGATFHILFRRYNETTPYPVVSDYEAPILTWTPTATDTAVIGVGYTEVRAIDPETGLVKKSRIIPTSVENSVTGNDSEYIPEPMENWANKVLAARDDAIGAAAYAALVSHGEKGTLGFVMPEMFGAKCDGVTDDSQAVQDAIDYAHAHRCAFKGSGGVYAVETRIELVTAETYDHPFRADFNGSTLKATAALDEVVYINTAAVAGYDTPGKYPRWISNLVIDGNGLADYGVHDVFGRSLYFANTKIHDVLDTCFKADENVNGGGLAIDTMILDHSIESTPAVCGIDVGVSDAKISHVKMRNINKAVILRKSSCFLEDVHPYLASDWSFVGSVCYDLKATSQHFESCYADTYEISWNIEASQHIFSNCQVYWAMNLYPASAEIPVVFNLASASLANYIVISSMLINAGSYYSTTGNKVHLFNFSRDQLTGANLYDLMKTSAYANWNSLDNVPIVADYASAGNYSQYQNGSQIGQTSDLDTLYSLGRYYTLGQNLPAHSPISGQNYELVVEYMLDQSSARRKQTLTTQYGFSMVRTCDTSGIWGAWCNTAYLQQGTESVEFTSGGSQTSDVTITFDKPFVKLPAVMLTPIADSANVNYAKAAFIVKSVSTTGFVLRGIMETPSNFTAYIKWVALV